MSIFRMDIRSVHVESDCHIDKMSQQKACRVDEQYGSKRRVIGPWVDRLSLLCFSTYISLDQLRHTLKGVFHQNQLGTNVVPMVPIDRFSFRVRNMKKFVFFLNLALNIIFLLLKKIIVYSRQCQAARQLCAVHARPLLAHAEYAHVEHAHIMNSHALPTSCPTHYGNIDNETPTPAVAPKPVSTEKIQFFMKNMHLFLVYIAEQFEAHYAPYGVRLKS